MEGVDKETCNGKCNALVLFNTRALGGSYKSVSDMIRPNSDMPWGNHFTFLPVSLPKLTDNKSNNPLYFVQKAHKIIDRKMNSASVWLTSKLLDLLRKLKGPEVCSTPCFTLCDVIFYFYFTKIKSVLLKFIT